MVIEMALLLPVILTMVLGALQLGLVLLTQTALEAAVHNAARRIRTGEIRTLGASAFQAQMCIFFDTGFLDCNKLVWNVKSGTSFTALQGSLLSAMPASSTYSPGSGGNSVLVQVYYKQLFVLPFVSSALMNGTLDLGATTIIRNED